MKSLVIGLIVSLIVVILGFSGCTQVNTGEVGVKTVFGKVSGEPLPPGIYFTSPIGTTIHILNTRVQTTTADSQAASKDLQVVHTAITMNYNLSTSDPRGFFTRLGNDQRSIQNSIVIPAMSETFKAVVADFTAEQLIDMRPQVSLRIESLLTTKLKQYDLFVDSISITNFQFSDSFNEAIEAKVTAQQSVLKAENDLQRIKIEAEQKITEAEANATAMQSQKAQVTPEILQMEAIKKWDGHLPQYVTGGSLPFILGNK